MLVVGAATLREFAERHPQAAKPLDAWYKTVVAARWRNIVEVRKMYPHADFIRDTGETVFNIGGNKYRLLVVIDYQAGLVHVRDACTHAAYSRRY